jgi:hypothetical protein
MSKDYDKFIGKKVRVLLYPVGDNRIEGNIQGSSALSFGGIRGSIQSKGSGHRVLDGILEEETERFLDLRECRFWYDITENSGSKNESEEIRLRKDEVYMIMKWR